MIFSQADVQSRAMVDFDQLVSQKNYRQIYEDRMRFIAATAMYPEKQEQLRKVLEDMQVIETALIQAQEIEKRGDYAGAWESAEKAFRNYPDDNKLNQVRANLTTKAADFVHAIRQAEELEQKNQPGSSLSWYLKAQNVYPAKRFRPAGSRTAHQRDPPTPASLKALHRSQRFRAGKQFVSKAPFRDCPPRAGESRENGVEVSPTSFLPRKTTAREAKLLAIL